MYRAPRPAGAATFYKYRSRNLITKQKIDITLRGGESLNEPTSRSGRLNSCIPIRTEVHFLDDGNYEQYSLASSDLTEELQYMTEGLEGLMALIYNDQCVGIQLPVTVELNVVRCDPGIKGASATSRTKPAIARNRPRRSVPEYLSEGERIKIDTRNGEYISRA